MASKLGNTPVLASKDQGMENQNKKKGRGRAAKGSRCNTPVGSTSNSPLASPNKYKALDIEGEERTEETWTCNICKGDFSSPDDKLLECQRCKDHYCITCLGKSAEEYNLMANSDLMWFCVGCREKVERNILTDRKIEETCKEMTKKFEERLKQIEKSITEKCNKAEVREVVREELEKRTHGISDEGAQHTDQSRGSENNVQEVLKELSERKNREANLVIYGTEECLSDSRDTRKNHDIKIVEEIIKTCESGVQASDILQTIRLGKFNKDKPKRPILAKLKSAETKSKIFKGIRNLNDNEKFRNIRVANDLTKTERDMELRLQEEAKQLRETSSGEFTYKVRGPPWARKIVRLRVEEEGK